MTKKKFIKTLRAYGLSRKDINMFVTYVANKQGKISYSATLKGMWLAISKRIVVNQPALAINWDYKPPVEFVDTEFYKMDYRLFDSVVVEPNNFVVLRGCDL